MLTPGGHRRFSSTDIHEFAQQQRKLKVYAPVGAALVQKALTQTRQVIVANPDQKWLAVQDDSTREQHRVLGRRLMGMTLQFISDEGNGALLTSWPELKERVDDVLERANGRPGHIFNLGHGIFPNVPVDNVRRVVEYVQEVTSK